MDREGSVPESADGPQWAEDGLSQGQMSEISAVIITTRPELNLIINSLEFVGYCIKFRLDELVPFAIDQSHEELLDVLHARVLALADAWSDLGRQYLEATQRTSQSPDTPIPPHA